MGQHGIPGVVVLTVAMSLTVSGQRAPEGVGRLASVHPGRNVEEFAPVEARWLRFSIDRTTTGAQPCLDELEVYGPDDPLRNVALAAGGTRARASGTLPGFRIHALPHVHDGIYGNGHSWISDTLGSGWVELEFPAPVRIDRVIWSRDRERKFIDRLATDYRVEVASEPGEWQVVASSADREPLPALPVGTPPYMTTPGHFSASATELPADNRPSAREYLLETWRTARGLPSNTVTAILQGRDGWLWIGTTNGLARFDGLRFTTYGEGHGLLSLSITCLLEDSRGRLWVGTEGGGLARWEDGYFEVHDTGQGLTVNTVLALAEGPDGELWVGTAAGFYQWANGQLVRRAVGAITRIALGTDGLWCIVGGNEMMRWDGRALVKPPAALDPSRFSSVSALAGSSDGALWFGGANGYVGRLADGAVTTFGEGDEVLASSTRELLPTPAGDVWVGTSASGLARLRDRTLLPVTTDDGLAANSVRALCLDLEGNLWVGTIGGGLSCLRPRRIEAVTTRDGLSHNGVMALAEDAAGTLWIGTNGGGLNRWAAGHPAAEPSSPSYVLENRVISALAASPDGTLWLGTSTDGAYRVEAGVPFPVGPDEGLPGRIVSALRYDATGGLWIGTLDGGPVYYSEGRIFRPAGVEAMAGLPVTAIETDASNRVWFAMAGHGVARLDSDGRLRRWMRGDGLASQFIRTLREDSRGVMWAGSSGGLIRWQGDDALTFTQAHGLPDDVISQILDDGTGHLWLGTNRGVVRIPLESLDRVAGARGGALEVLTLGTDDGLPGLECTGGYHPAGARLSDGRLCFGTVAGLAIIDPHNFAPQVDPPPVFIESMTVGQGTPTKPNREAQEVVAFGGASRLGFRFTAPTFSAPARLRFQCRMEGFESDWVDNGTERTISYATLAPGSYRFLVRASADGRTWSEPGAVGVRVPAPWWRRPWAVTGSILGSLGLAAGVARAITRHRWRLRLKHAEEQVVLERERSRIARDIHDDLGANLSQITLLSALGREQRQQPDAVEVKFRSIGTLASELVQALDAIVWAVNPRHDTLESLARYLVRVFGDFCAPTQVRLRLDVPAQLPDVVLGSEVRHSLYLAAKEALHNAVQHAGASEIRLHIAVDDRRLHLAIADDGHGFEPARRNPEDEGGNGLANMRHRLTECGGACEIISAPGRGTRVEFSLPIPSSS
ncbi:MAG: two-component regulator propeller domain-containing protein [Verrucomicrobiales bacterium]